jgi:hypothetical protein
MKKIVKMIDPPSGWEFGFPKEIPDDIHENGTDIKAWLIKNGYPQEKIDLFGNAPFPYRIIYRQINEKKEKMKKNISNKQVLDGVIKQSRKYLPTLSELIDRLSIAQLKEVFIPEHKKEYSQEIKDILHDIQLLLNEGGAITSETIRAIVVLSQMNLHIWHNESNYRKGIKDGNNLELTHGINGIRNTAKNKIQEVVGGRKDYKIDCLAADFKDWEISW